MIDEDSLTQATKMAQKMGLNVFNIFQVDPREDAHCEVLIQTLEIPSGSFVLDVGSGVGFFAKKLLDSDTTLKVACLNSNAYQLSQTPKGCDQMLADMHSIPVEEGQYDVLVCSYTIGFSDIEAFLKEAARVLKVGGVMWVYDMEGASPIVKKLLHYKTLPKEEFVDLAETAGFDVHTMRPDRVYNDSFMKLLEAEPPETRALIKIGLTSLRPVLYKLTRKT